MRKKILLPLMMALPFLLMTACNDAEEAEFQKVNRLDKGLQISDYEVVTVDYLSAHSSINTPKSAGKVWDIVLSDAAGAAIGALATLQGGGVVGAVCFGTAASIGAARPDVLDAVIDVGKKVANFVSDVTKDLWGSLFGKNDDKGGQNIPPDPNNSSDILDYDLKNGMLHYEMALRMLEEHPDLKYDRVELYNVICLEYDKNFVPVTGEKAEKLSEALDVISSPEFIMNYEDNLHDILLDGISDKDIQTNKDFVFRVVSLYEDAIKSTSDVAEFYDYSISMENMLHNYYLESNKSKLVYKTMCWMSVCRRGYGFWSKFYEYVK